MFKYFQNASITSKLTSMTMMVCVFSLLLAGLSFFMYEQHSYKAAARNNLLTLANVIGENSAAALAIIDQESAEDVLNALQSTPDMVSAAIFDREGQLFATYVRADMARSEQAMSNVPGFYSDDGGLELYHPIKVDGEEIGTIYFKSNLEGLTNRMINYATIVMCVIALASVLGLILGSPLQRFISKPILRLAKAAKQVSEEKDYSVRVGEQSGGELGVLESAFDQMLHQIQINEEAVAQSKKEIEALHRRNELILNSAGDGIFGLDLEGNITFANPAAAQLVDSTIAELVRYPVRNLIQEAPDRMGDPKCISNSHEADTNEEAVFLRQGTIPFPVEFSNTAILNKEGDVTGSVLTFRDVSERKEAEIQLQQSNLKLSRSNSELQNFAYAASHDLQEPLRKVRTFGDRLQAKCKGRLTDAEMDYIERMRNATSRMQELITGLLEFSRVTTQAKPFTSVVMNDVIRGVLNDLEVAIENAEAEIVVEKMPTMMADELQIRMLFQNLISNAVKFSHPDRKPVVQIRCKGINRDRGGMLQRCYQFDVSDNGVGFDGKYADKIFEVFQRLHNRTEYPGTGIGLAICRKIMDRHDGKISVRSELNVGTTFTVVLPEQTNTQPSLIETETETESELAEHHA